MTANKILPEIREAHKSSKLSVVVNRASVKYGAACRNVPRTFQPTNDFNGTSCYNLERACASVAALFASFCHVARCRRRYFR